MNSKIVLPKFNVPGQRSSHFVVRALWCVGGLVAVQAGLFAFVVWQRQGADLAATTAIAQTRVPVVALTDSRKIAAPAVAHDGTAQSGAHSVVAEQQNTKAAATDAPAQGRPTKKAVRSNRRTSRSSHLLARAPATNKTPSSKSSRKPDPLDDLLKRFR